ncbi:MAG TPA: arginine--tRNA ligase [Longimicrobiales bacterium]|nr:arginine--tRNA ligase [Longimicrobiales bacterium]
MSVEQLRVQLERLAAELGGAADAVQLETPRNPEHGDLATSLAMVLARQLRRNPRELAQEIVARLDLNAAGLEGAEIAGPGFINFRFASASVHALLADVIAADRGYGRTAAGRGQRIIVEFVSANPTGPLHVAHGRGAALGDAIAALLESTGHEVSREYYVNDAGLQIDRLAESVDARWHQQRGEPAEVPEGGYHGDYVIELARALTEERGGELATLDPAARLACFRERAVAALRAEQDADLRAFGVVFDTYFSETTLYDEQRLPETLAELEARGLTYERDGATWLRTSAFGDDKDRVLVKSDGSFTYFLPDIAYHRDKARRGYTHAINVWGADHHGYVPRMKAALGALGLPDFLDVEIVQMVRIMRGGREAKFSKRAGDFVTLRELFEETGRDVARYFFLMRRCDTQMLFDLDLALDQSEKNPVYKVQYAHARMMSIFRRAGVEPATVGAGAGESAALTHESERELIKQLSAFPRIVERAAEARAPHVVCDYLEATAGMVNSWYHAGNPSRNPELAVLVADPALRRARLALVRATRIVLRNGLELLGLTAPERMDREASE